MEAPKIIKIPAKQLIGASTRTSSQNSNAVVAWKTFMPRLKEIKTRIGNDLFSVQHYDEDLNNADPNTNIEFTTWAATEVSDDNDAPSGLTKLKIEGGLYAVFIHVGSVVNFNKTAAYIFGEWIPNSIYKVDNRKHFEILGEKYLGPMNPESEEEVWIPIILK